MPGAVRRMHWHHRDGRVPAAAWRRQRLHAERGQGLARPGNRARVVSDAPAARADVPGVVMHADRRARGVAPTSRHVDSELDATPGRAACSCSGCRTRYGQRSMNVGFCRWVRAARPEGRRRRADGARSRRWDSARDRGNRTSRRRCTASWCRCCSACRAACGCRSPRGWITTAALCVRPAGRVLLAAGAEQRGCRRRRGRRARSAGALCSAATARWSVTSARTRSVRERELEPLLERVASLSASTSFVLMGRESDAFRLELIARHPELAARVHATGALPPETLSVVLQACDVVAQPYADGASSRRGTLMAALAHGVPVVTTEGRLSEPVWRESRAVRLVPPGETDAMAREILALGNDATERARLIVGRPRLVQRALRSVAHDPRARRGKLPGRLMRDRAGHLVAPPCRGRRDVPRVDLGGARAIRPRALAVVRDSRATDRPR